MRFCWQSFYHLLALSKFKFHLNEYERRVSASGEPLIAANTSIHRPGHTLAGLHKQLAPSKHFCCAGRVHGWLHTSPLTELHSHTRAEPVQGNASKAGSGGQELVLPEVGSKSLAPCCHIHAGSAVLTPKTSSLSTSCVKLLMLQKATPRLLLSALLRPYSAHVP